MKRKDALLGLGLLTTGLIPATRQLTSALSSTSLDRWISRYSASSRKESHQLHLTTRLPHHTLPDALQSFANLCDQPPRAAGNTLTGTYRGQTVQLLIS